jgi:hypothetical protein
MIYFVSVLLKDIFEQGKDFPWLRPEVCPCCGHYKLWGHGFASRFFDGFTDSLFLKCYRCPGCGRVITLRPDTHFSRIRSSKEAIRTHLERRLKERRWPISTLSRPRLRHWRANLQRQTLAHLTAAWKDGFLAAFDRLIALGKTPVSRLR